MYVIKIIIYSLIKITDDSLYLLLDMIFEVVIKKAKKSTLWPHETSTQQKSK